MTRPDELSRRALFGLLSGRNRVSSAGDGRSGLDPLAARADQLFKNGDFRQAAALYADMFEREPEQLEALRRQGLALMHAGIFEDALAVWERVLTMAPDDPAARLYQGLTHARAGSVDEAVAAWRCYRNYHQIELQRELNLIVALADDGRSPDAETLVERVETALQGKR